jgi:hypothetical protein
LKIEPDDSLVNDSHDQEVSEIIQRITKLSDHNKKYGHNRNESEFNKLKTYRTNATIDDTDVIRLNDATTTSRIPDVTPMSRFLNY